MSSGKTIILLIVLVIVAAIGFNFFRTGEHGEPEEESAESHPLDKKERFRQGLMKRHPDLDLDFSPFSGVVQIIPDAGISSVNPEEETGLDGMDWEQIAQYRIGQVERYRELGFFHDRYHPFKYYHQRIYKSITPGKNWLGPTPYFVSNPYLLIILTCANHVTPLNLYCPEVDITYNDGVIEEVRQGNSAHCWFKYVFQSSDYPGKIAACMVNAWDAGFFFIHVDLSRSRNIGESAQSSHVTNQPLNARYLFHVGKYKKNNLSPKNVKTWLDVEQPDVETVIYINIWRYPPLSVDEEPDLVYIFKIFP